MLLFRQRIRKILLLQLSEKPVYPFTLTIEQRGIKSSIDGSIGSHQINEIRDEPALEK